MRIDIISVLPELLKSPFSASILKRAIDKGLIQVQLHDLKDYAIGKSKRVDDYAYGGSAGMVLMPEPLDKAISKLKAERNYDAVIYLTPDGEPLDQKRCNQLSLQKNLMLICGHYKGIDQRIREIHITREISIGDYVLSGGELAAAVLSDALIRLIPGVLNDETAALSDSFQDALLAPPIYTRPATYKGKRVPDVLRSGNFTKIQQWQHEQAVKRTEARRPDLLREDM